MLVKLWHFTDPHSLERLRTDGFRPNHDAMRYGTYFSRAGEMHWKGSHGPSLLELLIDIEEHELDEYKRVAGDGNRDIPFYTIPSTVLQAHRTVMTYYPNFDTDYPRQTDVP